MNCQRCGANMGFAQGSPQKCPFCGHVAANPAADPRIAALMQDQNQNGIPDVIEAMAARGAAPMAPGATPMGLPLAGGSFRSAPSVDLGHVPPAPRRPSGRARQLIFSYQGSQKVMLIIGAAFLAMGTLFTLIFCWGLPVDVALAFGGKAASGTVTATEVQHNVKVNGRHPSLIHFRYQVNGAWREGSSSALDSALLRRATPGASVPLEVFPGMDSWVRIEGTTYSTFGYIPVFVLIFPLVGFFIARSAVRSNKREIKAFTRGTPALARVTFKGPDTSTKMNGRHPFMLRWTFQLGAESYSGSLSHMDAGALMPLVVDEHVVVLYDPESPATNTVYVA